MNDRLCNQFCRGLALAVFIFATPVWTAERTDWESVQELPTPGRTKGSPGSGEPIPVLSVDDPGIVRARHLVRGEIRYAGVTQPGYIEMWTVYGDGSRYFSRTLSESGPMGRLEGDSDWRLIELPFLGENSRHPVRLEVNAILPGGGEIEWRGLALFQDVDPAVEPWWSERTASIFGSLLGSVYGMIGAVGGVLAGLGRARGFVLTLLGIGLAGGLGLLAAGCVALLAGQPYEVWYLLLLGGGVSSVVCGVCLPIVRRAYLHRELRRIAAVG